MSNPWWGNRTSPLGDWSDTPYTASWAARTAFFLAQHSARFGSLPDTDEGAVNLQENLHLFLAEGWRD